jgi:hypothetical protein
MTPPFGGHDNLNPQLGKQIPGLTGSEIGIYQIQVCDLNRFAHLPLVHGEIDGHLGLPASIVSHQDYQSRQVYFTKAFISPIVHYLQTRSAN